MFSIKSPMIAQLAQNAMRQMNAQPAAGRQCLVVLVNSRFQNHQQFRSVSTTKLASEPVGQSQSRSQLRSVGSPALKKDRSHSLPRNMVYRVCKHNSQASFSSSAMLDEEMVSQVTLDSQTEVGTVSKVTAARPLVLLFAWMLSKDSHIEKYREMWISRGYDILTVRTSPFDLLLPYTGGRRVAGNVFNFLTKLQPRYDEIIVHAFSVGGYQMGEFFNRIAHEVEAGNEEAEKLFSAFRGWIVDSCVFADDCPPGLSRAITRHPIMQPIIEKSISGFLKATKPFTMNRYYMVSDVLFRNERRIPGLLLFSKDDLVSNWNTNYALSHRWRDQGALSRSKCWDSSPHVLHYKEYPEEYEREIDSFVSQLRITKAPKC